MGLSMTAIWLTLFSKLGALQISDPKGTNFRLGFGTGFHLHRSLNFEGYVVSRCQQYDWPAVNEHKVVWHDNEAAAGLSSERSHDEFDFGIATSARCDRLHFERSGSSLEIAEVICPTPRRRVAIEQ